MDVGARTLNFSITVVIRVCFTEKVVTEPRLKGSERVSQAEKWRRKHFRQREELGYRPQNRSIRGMFEEQNGGD